MLPVSVVVRTLNEAGRLKRLLIVLQAQSLQPNELIVVDNESADHTRNVARSYDARIVTIPRDQFSYPKSLNVGMAAASNPVVVSLVGHALPVRQSWLGSAVRHFNRPEVAGVYSAVQPDTDAGLLERMMYNYTYCTMRKGSPRDIDKATLGMFAATCHAVRRSVWEEHPFDERYGAGGEDVQWARWALKHGHRFVYDHAFSVKHSHGLGTLQMIKQQREWLAMRNPRPFDRGSISYRRRDKAPST